MLSRSIFLTLSNHRPHTVRGSRTLIEILDYALDYNIEKVLSAEGLEHLPLYRKQHPWTSRVSQDTVISFFSSEYSEADLSAVNHLLERMVSQVLGEFYMAHRQDPTLVVNIDGHLLNGSSYVLCVDVLRQT